MAAAFGSLLGMTSLLTIGLIAVGAAAIQAVMKALPQVKSLDDAMRDHEASLKRVAEAYGGVAEAAAKAGRENKRLVDAVALRNAAALSVAVASESKDYFGNSKVGSTPIGGRFRGFQATTTEFQEPLAKLRADVKAGKADFDAFYDAIARKVEANPSLAKAGNDVIAESDKLKQAADQLKEYQRVQDALFNDIGPNKQLLSQGTTNTKDMSDYALYQSQQAVAGRQSSQAFYARLASEAARTTAERVAAARAEAAAQHNDESSPARKQRIDQAGIDAYVTANRELNEAARERKLSLDAAIVSQQQDLGLVGKVGAAAESLRRQYQLTADLRSEAAKRGITDEKEFLKVYADQIALIKQNADEYGRLAEARARAQLSSDLSFQSDQFNRSPEQRNIADQLKSAGLPIDFTSQAAKQLAEANARDTQRAKDLAQRSLNAQVAGINARSPAERVAAARAAAEAQYDPKEPTDLRQQRINNAELIARVQITKELADAERERTQSLKKLVEDQQQDIAMIGKTGGAAAAATQQYQLMAQLRAEAVKQGITSEAEFQKTFGSQIDLIKRATTSYGELVDARAKAQLNYDLADKNKLAGMSARDQQIIQTQRQYGLAGDPNSDTGQQIGQDIDRQNLRDGIKTFFTDLEGGLTTKGKSLGEALGDAVKNAAMNAANKALDNLFSQIANGLTSLLMGGNKSTATAVTGVGAQVAGLGTQTVGRLISPAPIATQPMPAISSAGTTKTGISLARIATSNGLGADVNAKYAQQFQGFVKDLEATGYKIKSIGGYNYRNIAGTNKLSNHAFGDAIDINPQQNPMGKNLVTDLPSNVGELAAKNGLSWGGAWNSKKDAMHFEVPDSAAALDKLASSAGNATKGLGTFGTGVGQLGQQLTGATGSIFPAAPAASGGGGGIFGWLGGLFGGASKSSQWNAASAGKLLPGLFADGGYTGPGGKNTPAGIVHAGEFVVPKHIVDKIGVPALSTMMKGYANGGLVTPALVSAPTAPALRARAAVNGGSSQPGVLQVHITGANGDDHVRTLVKQGVGEGLSTYNTQQQRGGFGTLQSRFNAQKG
ncbi:M15 family peptidase [Rhizobium rhizogenes]|nr:M15 family metallopeptidase [Rhizobium rhizogenes]TRB14800.1 M15 family peptidase [Rhizobium rhizogenes]TRB47592.1 M15 family peptidase [Rhizobium rhizogenes]TRB65360.1 M15 family peptidase [Rhizobium rhizogenes]